MCGYKMKPTNTREEYNWKCIWVKKCGYEAYETFNGTIHWYKKTCKQLQKTLGSNAFLVVYSDMNKREKFKIGKRK